LASLFIHSFIHLTHSMWWWNQKTWCQKLHT